MSLFLSVSLLFLEVRIFSLALSTREEIASVDIIKFRDGNFELKMLSTTSHMLDIGGVDT